VTKEYDTFKVDGFRLGIKPEVKPQILVAALREGMLRLAAREADGTIINWLSPEDVTRVAEVVHGLLKELQRKSLRVSSYAHLKTPKLCVPWPVLQSLPI
jgi:alkanesulfonate monooxygenase SsuD/methylene tetrahydromethanopterin reductase-like flavin-dependent oxidoreductase (luciferase family)